MAAILTVLIIAVIGLSVFSYHLYSEIKVLKKWAFYAERDLQNFHKKLKGE